MATSRIKGITVEIGGDTTKLQTALKGVNAEIKNTQSQLKDVEKLLKLDPGNTELLAQKQKLLSSAVSETKEKLAMPTHTLSPLMMELAGGAASMQCGQSYPRRNPECRRLRSKPSVWIPGRRKQLLGS